MNPNQRNQMHKRVLMYDAAERVRACAVSTRETCQVNLAEPIHIHVDSLHWYFQGEGQQKPDTHEIVVPGKFRAELAEYLTGLFQRIAQDAMETQNLIPCNLKESP